MRSTHTTPVSIIIQAARGSELREPGSEECHYVITPEDIIILHQNYDANLQAKFLSVKSQRYMVVETMDGDLKLVKIDDSGKPM